MKHEAKNLILSKAHDHIEFVCVRIKKRLESLRTKVTRKAFDKIRTLPPDEQRAQIKIFEHNQARVGELTHLYPSPYFVRCDVFFEDQEKETIWYFSKFQFSDESIYSWASPAAIIRFENPGSISYKKPDGSQRHGKLIRKDQYMIVNGKILFLSTESIDTPRELVHQEHFTTKKIEFALPEIVAQMEKAQDQVIRAHHKGPFVISGPAGSGKTTLALHRVAYLVQSPDTAAFYQSEEIVVFVQDNGTREYFTYLLPELGIISVVITTFAEWAMRILEIENYTYGYRYGNTETEKDCYEYAKLGALKTGQLPPLSKNIFNILESVYARFFSAEQLKILARQKKDKVLDRFDLTLLLNVYKKAHRSLDEEKQFFEETKSGVLKKKTAKEPILYSLIIIDEFQNYLPQQLQLLKGVIDTHKQSVVYVGDLAQQTQLGTIKKWEDIGEFIDVDRHVTLQKIYRNTEHILSYIRLLGYNIDIPDGVKKGTPVVEKIFTTKQEEITYVQKIVDRSSGVSIGVLAKDESYIQEFKNYFVKYKNVHVLTMSEAQGVEFEIVCIVGITKDLLHVEYDDTRLRELAVEKKKVNKDLLYVALTRAISELHVLGRDKLKSNFLL